MAASAKIDLKFLTILGLPSAGLTFAVTVLSAYLPHYIRNLANPIVIGLILGAEGFFGLFMPILIGNISDRSPYVGGRFRYLALAAAFMAGALCLIGVFHQLVLIAVMVALFYAGYYAYLGPYWAIYPDLVPKSHSGRSRSAESAWRVAGSFTALVGGGFLISLWTPLPFLLGAGLIAVVTSLLGWGIKSRSKTRVQSNHQSFFESLRYVREMTRSNPAIRNLVIANALWNATLRSILAFTVLFFTVGVHRTPHFVSGFIFPVAAIGMVSMAPLAGKLADKVGHIKVISIALIIYAAGTFVAGVTQQTWVIAIVPLVSGAAATLMALPFALLMRLLKNEAHGAASGLFGISRGMGSFIGPAITGAAIVAGKHFFSSTNGYAALWWACGMYLTISLFFVRRIYATTQA